MPGPHVPPVPPLRSRLLGLLKLLHRALLFRDESGDLGGRSQDTVWFRGWRNEGVPLERGQAARPHCPPTGLSCSRRHTEMVTFPRTTRPRSSHPSCPAAHEAARCPQPLPAALQRNLPGGEQKVVLHRALRLPRTAPRVCRPPQVPATVGSVSPWPKAGDLPALALGGAS